MAQQYLPSGSRLASAAAPKSTFGLPTTKATTAANPLGLGSASGFAVAPARPTPPVSPNPVGVRAGSQTGTLANLLKLGQLAQQASKPTPAAAAPNPYDLSTDPALQQVQSLTGLSNEQAQSEALKERQGLLLAYGDSGLASAVLGANDPTVAAAGQNPTSTLASLLQQKSRNLKTLDDGLNAANLIYSGYRVTQETQAAQDYQNALAQAAAGVNSNLDQITGNLNSTENQNSLQLAQAIADAQARADAAAAAGGVDPGAGANTAAGAAPQGRLQALLPSLLSLAAAPKQKSQGGLSGLLGI